MTQQLQHKHCVPCEGGASPLNAHEIEVLMKNLKGWIVHDNKEIHKKFHFVDFKRALTFVNEVGDIAEFEGHHPDINLHQWNKVTITLSTHAIKGLSENDFIMAAKIDQIIADSQYELQK
jgi:4a-hydroxytetrahydrobiopterin dehydratase